jgi:hypothetical protein
MFARQLSLTGGISIDEAQGIQVYLWNVFNRIVEHKGDPH